ncbi:MAG: ornithine carbamoyltransferase [Clostridia bacterium]|nr:ornithine carbamoyltransferase [Clostridia bacterium]
MKHFISITDITKQEFDDILTLAHKLKKMQKTGTPHPYLAGKSLGMIFAKSSTRTRVSFEVGMYQLGGHPLFLSSNDIQLGRGETIYDTANVLSGMLDGIMIRTFSQDDVYDLAKYGSIPVINALTDLEHPCQAMADMQTIYEEFGTLEGLKFAYVGDGNNMAHSLAHACAMAGIDCYIATPEKYKCVPDQIEKAKALAKTSKIVETTDPEEAMKGANIVYTDTWVSMGQEAEKATKVKEFGDYQVNQKLFSLTDENSIFLHCLPAYRGFEVTEDVIDGPHSRIFQEAENRLHAQKAIMTMLMAESYKK